MASERPALNHLGWVDLCDHLAGSLVTSLAARELASALEEDLAGAPIDDGAERGAEKAAMDHLRPGERSAAVAIVRGRFAELDELEAILARAATAGALGGALAAVVDVRPAIERAGHGGLLRPEELRDLRGLLDAARILVTIGAEADDAVGPHLGRYLGRLDPLEPLASTLARSITDGPEGEAQVADDASPALARARARIRELRRSLRKEAESLLRSPEFRGSIRSDYVTEREGRLVLPLRADAYSRGANPGIIHDTSSRGGTLFVEPAALIPGNNALRSAELAAAAEVRRILEALSRAVGEAAAPLLEDLAVVTAIDGIRGRLALSRALGGITPRIVDVAEATHLELPAMRHPLLVLQGTAVVASDLRLAIGGALVISGPNAGGKTVALKTVGLAILLAQAGIRLPTGAPATLPLFRQVITDIGDDQSIAADLSTFSAHIHHLRQALAAAASDGPGTLVLVDEIAVGTDPEQGTALAEATLHHLVGAGATAVITTHYERLKELAAADPRRFFNAAVGFDLAAMAPTFRLTLGIPGPSSAFTVARRLGLPEGLLADAEARLASPRRELDALLLAVQGERAALAAEREALAASRREVAAQEAALREREAAAEGRARSQKERAYVDAALALRGLREEVRRLRQRLRERGDEPEALSAGRQGERVLRERLHREHEPAPAAEGAPPATLAVGDPVHVPPLGRSGEVIALQGKKVLVQIGAIRTSVRREELRPLGSTGAAGEAASGARRPKPKRQPAAPIRSWAPSVAAPHFGDDPRPVAGSVDNVVDLRGERAEEALRALDRFLDRALCADQEVVLIRHGHGSGALRQAIRDHLSRLGFVRRQRPGILAEGGEAVTVAWLDP